MGMTITDLTKSLEETISTIESKKQAKLKAEAELSKASQDLDSTLIKASELRTQMNNMLNELIGADITSGRVR